MVAPEFVELLGWVQIPYASQIVYLIPVRHPSLDSLIAASVIRKES